MKVLGGLPGNSSRNTLNRMGTNSSTLRKSVFMDKFYTGLGAKERDSQEIEEKKARLLRFRNVENRKSMAMEKTKNFRDQHKKLFQRESHRVIEKKPQTTKSTLFEKFREDYSDPFESAKESGATASQIKLINFSMFVLS
jgi:hypothetical protein